MEKFLDKLNNNAFNNLDVSNKSVDVQGWMDKNFPSIFENELIKRKTECKIIEVGTWKGLSTTTMAKLLQKHNTSGKIIAVDTWLGSPEFITGSLGNNGRDLKLVNGYPSVFYTFTSNVKLMDLTKYIYPLPLSSIQAADVLNYFKFDADIIYIDASHEYKPVKTDIETFWNLLKIGGVMIGDDYSSIWPGVKQAVNEFVAANKLKLGVKGVVWYIYK